MPGSYVSPTEIHCASPTLRELGPGHNLSYSDTRFLQHDRLDEKSSRQQVFPDTHYYPHVLLHSVELEITMNGRDYTDDGYVFTYT